MICLITVPSRGEFPHVINFISTGQSVQLRKAYYHTIYISTGQISQLSYKLSGGQFSHLCI